MFEELAALEALSGPGELSALETARLEAARQDAREAAQERQEQAEKAALREQRLEVEAFAQRTYGNPRAELSRAQAYVAETQDEVADLEARLERVRGKLDRAQSNVQFFAQRSQEAADMVSRAVTVAGPSAAVSRAQREAHAEYVRASREALKAARRSAGHPKGDGPCEVCAAGRALERSRPAQDDAAQEAQWEGRARLAGHEIIRGVEGAIVSVW